MRTASQTLWHGRLCCDSCLDLEKEAANVLREAHHSFSRKKNLTLSKRGKVADRQLFNNSKEMFSF